LAKLNETRPKLAEIPQGVVSLADYERLAEQRLDANAWAYLAGGAGDEITMRWNREAFERTALLPRVLHGGPGGNTRIELLGHTFEHPILVAPLAHQRLAHSDGECATAQAAAAQDAGIVVSTLSSTTMEDVAADAGPRRWFQLYFQQELAHTLDLVRRAESAGYEAIVVTVDAPLSGLRNREQRIGFRLPPDLSAVNIAGYPVKPPPEGARSVVFDYFMTVAPGWGDIAWLVSNTKLPVLLKGILTADDASLAIEHGAAGIVVSNHGGRTLDTLPSTFEVLPAIVEQVGGRVPVVIDGGIRRGTDVLKSLAAGAAAVMVGRPIVYGLAVAGAVGVSHVLRLLRDELELAMALTGCRTVADADRSLLMRMPTGRQG
jgi:4-hydroxymandelate oxidase